MAATPTLEAPLMLRQSLRGLAVAAAALGSPAPAAAVTPVSACTDLTKAGETYVLTVDISSAPDLACFRVLADRITLDLAGHTITGPGTGGPGTTSVAIHDSNGTRTSTVVKNGSVTNFEFGIVLNFSSRSTIRGVTTSDNAVGMIIGPTSLVKDCIVQRNVSHGIVTLDGVQVESCLIGGDDNGNGQYGLIGGQRMLVTRNTASGNGLSGILVGISSTVTHNTANDNRQDGIAVGQKSLVTINTANDNGDNGIEAVCPSTVTNNQASNNANDNFNLIKLLGAPDCFDKGNTSPDETSCLTGDSGLAAC
jgi:parallel beta-helix repeat protein